MISAREAAAALGGQVTTATSFKCPGPGHSPRDRSLSVRLDPAAPDGFIIYSFAGDDPMVCRDHVRAALGLGLWRPRSGGSSPPSPRPRLPSAAGDDKAFKIAEALRIWGKAHDVRGTLGEVYLRDVRGGLELNDRAREAIRFHPNPWMCGEGTGSGLIGLFRDLRTDEPCGLQRVFLRPDGTNVVRPDGTKLRRMLGRVGHAAVKRDGADWVELGLVIAEGMETALAARQLGFRPCWALGSAQAIGNLPVLPGIEALTILGENDENGTNARAARACARRWITACVDVEVLEPLVHGDANDVLRARAEHG